MQQAINIYDNKEVYSFSSEASHVNVWVPDKIEFTLNSGLYCFSLYGCSMHGLPLPYKSFCLDTPSLNINQIPPAPPREITRNGLNALKQTLNFLHWNIYDEIEERVLNRKKFSITYPENLNEMYSLISQNRAAIGLLHSSANILSIRHALNNQEIELIDYETLVANFKKTIDMHREKVTNDAHLLKTLNANTEHAYSLLLNKINTINERLSLDASLPQSSIASINQKI